MNQSFGQKHSLTQWKRTENDNLIRYIVALVLAMGVGINPTPVTTPTQVAPKEVKQEVQKPVEPAKVQEAPVVKKEEPVWIQGEATGYYNGKDKMNGESGITASGYNLDNGIYYQGYRILASDRSIPLGTLVELSLEDGSSITGIVLDRGGAITKDKFDIVFRTKKGCFDFGRQSVKYRIVGKVDL